MLPPADRTAAARLVDHAPFRIGHRLAALPGEIAMPFQAEGLVEAEGNEEGVDSP
jgi:hypothetical protein